jgi:hypothetical protein
MGTPFFILATGQSNIYGRASLSWSPNVRAKQWNNVVDSDTSVGTAYTAIPSNMCGIVDRYASNVAAADANKDVYYARYARNGKDISSWFGGARFNYPGTGNGQMALNSVAASSTQMYVSATDALGIRRPNSVGTVSVGDTVWLYQSSGSYQYTVTGVNSTSSGTEFNISVVSGSGSINPGVVQVTFSPRFLTMGQPPRMDARSQRPQRRLTEATCHSQASRSDRSN